MSPSRPPLLGLIERAAANYELIEMAWAAHDAAVESTRNWIEGHYSARRLREHLVTLNQPAPGLDPLAALSELIQRQENVLATFQTEIARLEA